ncbi:C-8 sterol isomerase Erg2 [Protomyces lactucae-debilis]|uniref:C-8 sterol isomerase n=1 Tax=Protomyces lactucae-debilis TaxID=2754530 RepID=A0A1Y2EVW2_PROLT|nr:C-8 sterol isomerase Erg2 [Protomyces lactucae-debilis]ORY75733.1 C-8 sterol isomerase Erg2 [Protomyces lactucae-debilis]
MFISSRTAILLAVLASIFYVLDGYLHTQYVFDPKKLQELSRKAIAMHGNNTAPLLKQLTRDLKEEYGDAISEWSEKDWFFNNAGGAMGSMVILHASITEYLIFFGTALQTEGHSGIHTADDYFTILVGQQLAAKPHDLEAHVYNPGDQNFMRRGEATQYAMPTKCFALELAQGWIPAMLPFGFADTFTSTLDFPNLWKTCKLTALHMGRQALRGKF